MLCKIYQPKHPTFWVKKEISTYYEKDFNCVWTKEFDYDDYNDDILLLNHIFEICGNAGPQPDDYKGYSLSVGDIVILGDKFYICKPLGWGKIKFVGCANNLPTCDTTEDLVANNID